MRKILLLIVFTIYAASAFAQSVSAPTNMTVTAERNSAGMQYFQIQFTNVMDSGRTGYYTLYRWNGALPDTSGQTQVVRFEYRGDSSQTITVDDSSSVFNPSANTSEYRTTYSYAATTEQYRLVDTGGIYADFSGMSSLVSGQLDSDYVYISGLPTSTITLQKGATWTDTSVVAHEHNQQNATFKYSVTSTPDTVATVTLTGNTLSVVANAYGTTRILVSAIDGSGRGGESYLYVTVPLPYDSVTVTLDDQNGNPIAGGTRYYCRLYSGNDTNASTAYNNGVTGLLSSSGSFQIPFQQGSKLFLRAMAEGYNAAWLSSGGLLTQITSGSSYTLDLSSARTHTFSGTATDTTTNKPVADARMILIRVTASDGYMGIDTTYTDTNGDYSFTFSEGDTLVGAFYVRVFALASGFRDSNQSTSFLSSLEDHTSANFIFGGSTTSQGYDTLVVYLSCPQKPDSAIHVVTNFILYKSTSAGLTTVDSIYTTEGGYSFIVSPGGKYIIFASPDSGYLSGYYKDTTYAATWDSAQTVGSSTSGRQVMYLIVPLDSSVMQQGGGVPVDGLAKSANTGKPLVNTHLILWANESGPAGATDNPYPLRTTKTDYYGNFNFGNIPGGKYGIEVDVVGAPPFWITPIIIGEDSVYIPINYVTGVDEKNSVATLSNVLSQNYPNPFSGTSDIAFTVSAASANVSLIIYNELGEPVKTLLSGTVPQGTYQSEVNGSEMLPGVYYYILRVGNVVSSRQMVVIR